MKQDRLFHILYILLDKRTITAPQLAQLLEVSVRTIYRDIDALSSAGVPIYTLSGKNGGISLIEDYCFDNSILTDYEQNELLFALQSIKATYLEVDKLLAKLGTVFKKQTQNWIAVDFSRWGHQKIDSSKFEVIKNSILAKQVLTITYQNSYGKETTRNIKPIKLIFKQSNWYLQSYCMKSLDFRLFKVNRITAYHVCDEVFTDTFDNLPSIEEAETLAPNICTLKLKIKSNMAYRVYDEFAPDHIVKENNGDFIVTVNLPIDNWVYNYIIGFGESIEILEPACLKSKIKKYIKKLANHFGT